MEQQHLRSRRPRPTAGRTARGLRDGDRSVTRNEAGSRLTPSRGHAGRATSPSRANEEVRASSSPSATRSSSRASGAPMHWWIPRPKPTCRFGDAVEVDLGGVLERFRVEVGRPEDEPDELALRDGAPPSSVVRVATRRIACCGASTRTDLLGEGGDQSRVARKRDCSSPSRARRSTALPIALVVVLCPAETNIITIPTTVSSSSGGSSGSPRTSALTMSSPGIPRGAPRSAPSCTDGAPPRRAIRSALPGGRLAANLVDPARPVVDQPPVARPGPEQQAERARRERVAEFAAKSTAPGARRAVAIISAAYRRSGSSSAAMPFPREVRVEHSPVDAVLGWVALERRPPRLEERHDVAEPRRVERRLDQRSCDRTAQKPPSTPSTRATGHRDMISPYAAPTSCASSPCSGAHAAFGSHVPVLARRNYQVT